MAKEDLMGVVGGASAVAGAVRASRGRHPLGARLMAVLPMVRDTLTGRWPGAPKGRVLGGLAGIVYLISPVDFMPEALLGPFGLGDDLALAAVSVAALLSAAE
ncbi:MAG: YkvA family protein, partial [Actinomycetota bacterium]